MKFAYAAPLFVAAAVMAQEPDASGVIVPDPATQNDAVRPFAVAFVAINSSTIALDNGILAFQGIDQVASLAQASVDLLNQINNQNSILSPLPVLSDEDAVSLPPYVVSLAYFVNDTISDLVERKQVFVDACVGPVVLGQLQQQNTSANIFQTTVLSKIPDDLQPIAGPLAQPIADAIASGVSAFADQTTQPASCTATSATSATTTVSGSATETTTTGLGVYPTGSVPTYGSGSIPAYTTPSVYPTGSYTTTEEDCEEEPTYSYTTDDCEETVYPTGAYPTGGYSSVGSYTSASHAVWEPVPYPSGSASYSSVPSKPTGYSSVPVYSSVGGYPTGSYPVASGSYPVTTGSVKPSGYSTSKVPVYTTTSAKLPVYTGAAIANNANIGAAAFAALAAVALL